MVPSCIQRGNFLSPCSPASPAPPVCQTTMFERNLVWVIGLSAFPDSQLPTPDSLAL